MAKKKMASASPFVPVEEQPYQIPDNWCWVRLNCVKLCESGFFDGDWILSENMDADGEIRLLQLSDIGIGEFLNKSEKRINEKTFQILNCKELLAGDIMIARMADPIARSCIVPEFPYKVITAVDIAVMRRNPSVIEHNYLNYLCNAKWFTDLAASMARGTTRLRITRQNLGNMPVPLPPLPEQQLIVIRIESLFAKLDEAKEKAQAVVDGFELRKSAILHKAFTGELTEKWRKENGVRLDSWKDTTIGKQAELITKGASPRWQGIEYTNDKSQTLFVTSENVREGYLDLTKEKYLNNKINDIQKRSVLKYGDVLVNIVGASIGRAAVYNLHQLANTNQAVCIVRLKAGINSGFVCAYLNSPVAQSYYFDNKVETARANVSLGSISAMYIKMPIASEQKEIVNKLSDLLRKEQQAKEAAEAVLAHIDAMKKAVLARAFRGELGTNDPAEEWAGEMVKKIL